jgi:hypothetical protein
MSTNGDPTKTTARSIYFTKTNLDKIDKVRGKIKRATLINAMIENLDESWLKSVIQ